MQLIEIYQEQQTIYFQLKDNIEFDFVNQCAIIKIPFTELHKNNVKKSQEIYVDNDIDTRIKVIGKP